MKKFTVKATALAIASVCGSAALAGSITAPAATTKYAVESMTSSTAITLPAIVYKMGVARTTAQDFTVILTPSSGSTFDSATCNTALPVVAPAGAAAGAATVSLKRASASECAYEVDVTTAFTDPSLNAANYVTLTMTGLKMATHTLATAGNTASVTLALKELGETAYIDNSGTLSVNVATSGNALTLTAAADTATKADVADEQGPLYGFVTVGDDADDLAKASFVVRNNNDGTNTWMKPDGTTPWNFITDGTSIAVTVSGNFQGMASTGGFTATTGVGTDPTVTATAAGSTATFTLLPANINAAGAGNNTTVTTTFKSARTASLGTQRTFGVSAVGDVATGADVTLSGNSSWWSWSANASQLMTPYLSTNAKYVTRFSLLNTGSTSVTYTVQCFAEGSNVATNGTGGSLKANGTTIIEAADACSFSDATKPRGAVIFTINAPINTVKGAYNIVDAATGSNGFVPLTRPYGSGNTTE